MKKVIALVLLLAACNFDEVAQCVSDAIAGALSRDIQVSEGESLVDINRPDESARDLPDGGGTLYVSGAHAGGRLVARFNGPLVGGQLPRVLPDAGCEGTGDYAFFYVPDGGTRALQTTLVVSSGDAGRTLLDFTQLVVLGTDGGSVGTLPDRTLSVPAP
jgi:hypothetical protein